MQIVLKETKNTRPWSNIKIFNLLFGEMLLIYILHITLKCNALMFTDINSLINCFYKAVASGISLNQRNHPYNVDVRNEVTWNLVITRFKEPIKYYIKQSR